MTFGHPVPHPRFLFQTLLSQFCAFPGFLCFLPPLPSQAEAQAHPFPLCLTVGLSFDRVFNSVTQGTTLKHLCFVPRPRAVPVSIVSPFVSPLALTLVHRPGGLHTYWPCPLVVVVGTFQFDFWCLPFVFSSQIPLLFSTLGTGTGFRVLDTENGFYCTYCTIFICILLSRVGTVPR